MDRRTGVSVFLSTPVIGTATCTDGRPVSAETGPGAIRDSLGIELAGIPPGTLRVWDSRLGRLSREDGFLEFGPEYVLAAWRSELDVPFLGTYRIVEEGG